MTDAEFRKRVEAMAELVDEVITHEFKNARAITLSYVVDQVQGVFRQHKRDTAFLKIAKHQVWAELVKTRLIALGWKQNSKFSYMWEKP